MLTLASRAVDPETQINLRPTGTAYQLAHLWRGTHFIKETSADLVDANTYQILFPPPDYQELSRETLEPRVEEFLELLRRKASQYRHSRPATPRREINTTDHVQDKLLTSDHESGNEYLAAIDLLQETFAVHRHIPNKVLAWLAIVGSSFMEAVNNQEPLASAITLFWSVTFRELDNMWWATGFRRELVNELVPLVSGVDPEFSELATWVASQI